MTPTIQLWAGAHLGNAECLNYVKAIVAKVNEIGPEALRVQPQAARLGELIPRLADFVTEGRAYGETSAIATADSNRDELFLVFWEAWNRLSKLDETHPLGLAARALAPVLTPYKGIYKHSLTKETEEINGLRQDLAKTPAVRDAVAALGLSTVLDALWQANAVVEAAYSQRDSSRAGRMEAKGNDTTVSLRKEAVNLILEIFRRINSLNTFEPSPAGQRAAQELAAIVEQRKQVLANAQKSPKTPDSPEEPV